MASAGEYRQTQSPDSKSKKAREDECQVKRRMTSHWDLDYLTRDELEEVMAQGVGDPDQRDTGEKAGMNPDDDDAGEASEHPVRTGLLLLGLSLLMIGGAAFLLQSAGG